MKTRSAAFEALLPFFIFTLSMISGCKVPQKTPEIKPQDTVFAVEKVHVIDSFYIEQGAQEPGEYELKPCPPQTVIKARKVKKSGNIDNSVSIELKNCFNENNDLKKSNQVYKSQVDSLIMATNKGNGNQTNNGTKWWVFVLLGMGIGVAGYQGIRSAITKRI